MTNLNNEKSLKCIFLSFEKYRMLNHCKTFQILDSNSFIPNGFCRKQISALRRFKWISEDAVWALPAGR